MLPGFPKGVPMELDGLSIALLLANEFEDAEALYPYYRLQEAGARVEVVAAVHAETLSSKHGYPLAVDLAVEEAVKEPWDGVVIPGGYAPDHVRRSPEALRLVRDLDGQGGLVAAICHGAWVLSSAGVARGRTLTGYWSIKDDLVNAGAIWRDEPVVIDRNLVTSRCPSDLPLFARACIDILSTAHARA
jgi:protease I